MKKFLTISIPILVLGAVLYVSQSKLRSDFLPILNNQISSLSAFFSTKKPCTDPIPYNLGTFDAKFKISKDYFLSALADAEAIWEKPSGINLFSYMSAYSSSDVLKINLIYDYRQDATSKLASLGIVVKNNKASYDMLKAKFTALQKAYAKEKTAFDAQLKDFNQKNQAYTTNVKYWNSKGGAPQQEYEKITATRLELEALSKKIKIAQTHINGTIDELNALVVVLNRLVGTLNLSVEKYNTTNVSRGESFEEGVYSSDGSTRKIDIYEFSSREKLVRVLAHELGHALDLDHLDDSTAIMYKLNQGNSQVLADTDLALLKTKCGVK